MEKILITALTIKNFKFPANFKKKKKLDELAQMPVIYIQFPFSLKD